MNSSSLSDDVLMCQLGYLQRRAHVLHGDATDRFIKAKLRALSMQVRHMSMTLDDTPGESTSVINAGLIRGVILDLQELEQYAKRRPRVARA